MGAYRTTFFAIGALAVATSCVGPVARQAARAATPAVIEGAIEGTTDKANQQKIAGGIDEESVEKIAERLSGKILDGTMKSLSDVERRKLVEETLKGVRVPIGMEGSMGIRVGSIDATAVAGAVDAAVGKALGRVNEAQMKGVVHGLVDEAVRTAFTSISEEMKKTGAPTETPVASLTRTLSREATLGFQDAIDEARRARDEGEKGPGEGSVLWAASRAAESGQKIFDVWKISLVVLALALVGGFAWALRQHRTHRRTLLQRDEALALLMKKAQETAPRSSASSLEGAPRGAPEEAPLPPETDGARVSRPSAAGPPHFS